MIKLVTTGITDDIIDILERQGLPMRQVLDMSIPNFPDDVTLMDDQDLMVLASKYMENYNMVRTQVSCAQIAELEAENDYDFCEAQALLKLSTGKTRHVIKKYIMNMKRFH